MIFLLNFTRTPGESGWFSGHQPCLPPLWPGFNSGLGSYVGWVSVDLNLTPRVFLRVLRFPSLRKIDSRPIPSGCGAVLRGHTWVVVRGRAPSRQHSSFGPTSLSCALRNSVSDCEKGRLADQILLLFVLSLSRHIEKQLGKRLKDHFFACILEQNKQTNQLFFLCLKECR